MLIITLLVLQSGVPALESAPDADLPPKLVLPSTACVPNGADEIVVCGERDDHRYRLPPLDTARFEPKRGLPKAEIGIVDGVQGAAETESVEIAPGQFSKRVMFRLKLPF